MEEGGGMGGCRIDYERDYERDYDGTSEGNARTGRAGNSAMSRRFERPKRSV